MPEPIFVNIATGEYDYWSEKHKSKFRSHCVYALDDKGRVWKYLAPKKRYVLLDELDAGYNRFDDFGDGL